MGKGTLENISGNYICLYVVILVQRNEQSSYARTMSGSPSNMLVRVGIIP